MPQVATKRPRRALAGPRGFFTGQFSALLPAETEAETDAAARRSIGGTIAAVAMMVMAGAVTRTAARALCGKRDPLANGATAAVISDDAILGHDRSAPGGVTDHTSGAIVAGVGLGGRGSCKAKNSSRSDDREECFHGRVELFPLSQTRSLSGYSAATKFFFQDWCCDIDFGSKASRRPSPRRFNASNVAEKKRPG